MTTLVCAAVTAAAAAAAATSATGDATPVGVATCAQHVEAAVPRPSKEEAREGRRTSIVVGAITFWGLRRARDHTFAPGGAHSDDGWKAGVSVRGYRSVTVRIAARDQTWLGLDYVQERADQRPRYVAYADREVRFTPCPPGTRSFISGRPLGPETNWAGTFLVARRGCATMFLRRAGDTRWTRVRVAFGTRCR